MKKKIALILIAAMAINLSACGTKEQVAQPAETVAEEAVEPEAEPEEEKEEIVTGVNIIPGGDFDKENSAWGTYSESGGTGNFSVASGRMKINVNSGGSVAHAFQVYCGGFELLNGGKYEMSFDISSSIERNMEWRIQYNSGDYHAYIEQTDVKISEEEQHVVCEFTMTEASDPAPRLCFNLGDRDEAQGFSKHEIYLDNVSLILTDASGCTFDGGDMPQVDININQLGYKPSDKKRAIFRNADSDTAFEIIDESGKTVYNGKVEGQVKGGSADETVAYGDFSDFTAAGTYKIKAAVSGESFPFTIAEDIYDDAFDSVTNMLYLQRCGETLSEETAGDFAHEACHVDKAVLYEDNSVSLDVSGGWHDAGDYGRYTVAGAKAVADILLAYENYPDSFSKSKNSQGILAEAKYELDWLLKMQAKDGGVYHKVTGLNFDGVDMPENCNDQLYVLPVSKTATADFAAVMYMAARIYKDIDSSYADKCKAAADKAVVAMESIGNGRNYTNPSDVLTGEYADNSSKDEYLWAYCEGYKTTGAYADKIKNFDYEKITDDAFGWATNTGYAYFALVTADKAIDGVPVDMKKKLLAMADEAKANSNKDSYGSSIIGDYPWGSNMTICNNGMALLMAYELTGDESYFDAAKLQLDYIYGCNTTSYSFVTGVGTQTPKNPHHRPSQTLGKAMPGMLAGGPDSNLEDPYAQAVLKDMPKAHCYADSDQTYSCNEITIYWNSPLIYLMAGIMSK